VVHKDAEADDPMELVGVVVPADAEAERDMAYVFAEEFIRMGYDGKQLLALFKTPSYAGPYRAYRALGEAAIHRIIEECLNAWGRTTIRVQDVQNVLNGSNDLNDLNPREEESEDG
jgi:hypothetical protein